MDFTVEVDGLKALGGNLRRCGENLEGALNALDEAGEDTLGRSSLDDACEEFQDAWRHGLDKIRECTGKITEGVDASRKAYAELDRALGDAFGKMADSMGNAPGGGPR